MSMWSEPSPINYNNGSQLVMANTSTIPTAPSTTVDALIGTKKLLTIISFIIVVILVAATVGSLTVVIMIKNTTPTSGTTTMNTTAAAAITTTGTTTLPSMASTTTVCSNNPTTTATTTVAPGSPVTLWSMSNPCSSTSSYFQASFYYYAQNTSETLTFGIVNGPAYTYLDDISVIDVTQSSTELLCNGGFENGTCICWSGTCPISTSPCRTGSYCINNGYTSMTYMSQTFNTIVGHLLYISFYTYWSGSGSSVTTSVTITP